MTEPYTRLARDRLQQLASTLATLHERVRDAVASEMGKAVGETLRDLLTAILNRNATRTSRPPERHYEAASPSSARHWSDDDDDWRDDRVPMSSPTFTEPSPAPISPQPVDAVRLGFGLAHWLLQRRVPVLAGIGFGLAAGLATMSSYPLVQTALAVIAAATELLVITEYGGPSP